MKVPMRDEDEDEQEGPGPIAGFIGGLMIATGFFISLLSGTCMLYFIAMGFRQGANAGGAMMMWATLFGGIPFVVGLVLFMTGLAIRKR